MLRQGDKKGYEKARRVWRYYQERDGLDLERLDLNFPEPQLEKFFNKKRIAIKMIDMHESILKEYLWIKLK